MTIAVTGSTVPDSAVPDSAVPDSQVPGSPVVGSTLSGSPATAPHVCPGLEPGAAAWLSTLLRQERWLMRALSAVAVSRLPDAWIGAGVIRDVVWGRAHAGFQPAEVRDIDVPYFDPLNLGKERDLTAQETLSALADLPWEATNQAAVHTWYHDYFGGPPVAPLASVHDAVATWPETATCVAVRLMPDDSIEVCAPYGLSDLACGVWRVNPVRVTPATSMARLARQRVRDRWPRVRVMPPSGPGDADVQAVI
jgi:hypothetical protein